MIQASFRAQSPVSEGDSPSFGTPELDDDADVASAADAQLIERLEALVPDGTHDERIDRVIARLFSQHSRARIQAWIDAGRLSLDGVTAHAKTRLRGGERAVLEPVPDPAATAFAPEPVALNVVHEDAAVLVIDKPAGLVVHPAVGNWSGTMLNGLLHRFPELTRVPRAGIVHRLDKDTSGLMVVARTIEAQTALVRQLQARTVSRRYFAVCWGEPGARTVDAPIGRDPRERTRMAVVESGKVAVTHLRTLARGALDGRTVSLVECRLETGRTHQIRVHLSHLGHPLVGDSLYAPRSLMRATSAAFGRQALHAYALAFEHPGDGRTVRFHASPPTDFVDLCRRAGIDLPGNDA